MKLIITVVLVFICINAIAEDEYTNPALDKRDKATALWNKCKDRVLKKVIQKGIKEYGDPSAYTGAGSWGAYGDIIKKCGYQPLTRSSCNNLYTQVYLGCQNRNKDEWANVERSYFAYFDPKGFNQEALLSLCRQENVIVNRVDFGILICGE